MGYSAVIEEVVDARISRRWKRWAYLGNHLEERHEHWMRFLLRRGVTVRTIQINHLDDPLLGDLDREALLEGYLGRKSRRISRLLERTSSPREGRGLKQNG